MKTIIILILLIILPFTCYAIKSPIDHVEDTIQRNTNDAMDNALSKVRIEAHEMQKEVASGVKNLLRTILGGLLEIFTILAIGYTLSFLVPKTTGKMMLVVTALCGLNQFLKLFV